jgi:hypothetical protein
MGPSGGRNAPRLTGSFHGLIIDVPMLMVLLLAVLRRRLWKRGVPISETLRRNNWRTHENINDTAIDKRHRK